MRLATSMAALALAGCGAPLATTPLEPAGVQARASEDAQVEALLSRMSLERKVAQLVMPDIGSITPEDVERYRFGVILNGGNSGPNGNDLAPAPEWLALADAYWDASTRPHENGEPVIPSIWATDAVHGHANVMGATIFPHNIGLGATGDADLVRRIGEVTATEIEITGIDWTFAPTIAVARDDRWGRTYESYSEDPARVAALGAAMTLGLQGRRGVPDYLGEGRVVATAKHFFGDGGTEQGVDQGDVNGDLGELKRIHAAPYPSVIDAGVESIMASFNSINGSKMHGNATLLTDYLRGELGFDGLVVGDWNGHGQVKGCTNSDCPQALMAGLDVYMVPEDWKALYETLLEQVRDGTIPMARVDEAAGRVLRLKLRAGLLGDVRPSERANAGEFSRLGAPSHRAVAREAVAKSMVLLKNDGVLPLKAGARLLVAGEAANSIARQSGGWTLTWQGGGELTNGHFPGATSIYDGIAAAASEAGGSARLSENGEYDERPDAAIIVFGEEPYAEFAGDRKDLVWRDEEGLELLRRYRAAGIPTVALFLSGRPMWVNRELNAANAFVAAWLPGSEGQGVADGLFGRTPFSGRLSFSWPGDCTRPVVNEGAEGTLFPLGYGLEGSAEWKPLSEDCAWLASGDGERMLFGAGRLGDEVSATAGATALADLKGRAQGFAASGLDISAQEDGRLLRWTGPQRLRIRWPEESEGGSVVIRYLVGQRPEGAVRIEAGCDGPACKASRDIGAEMALAAGKGERVMVITGQCLPMGSGDIAISADAPFEMKLVSAVRSDAQAEAECSF
ncbi:glycoside hydrolase family 3 protein [Sphingomicrobium lutaoense]|uniref:Beta-glucosidase n=1 Tax=Sphingomicrobium lutaoense TaxID=515949 RepID=A0A839Z0L9_9SPHN|nr:glycoside hydrolase family 3 protein [Sphingomicrobium lutaoense]MBB3763597.1 beta-glucosidase [Sphingomicrobium lutaoense]